MEMKSKNVSKYVRNKDIQCNKKRNIYIFANYVLICGDKKHLINLN